MGLWRHIYDELITDVLITYSLIRRSNEIILLGIVCCRIIDEEISIQLRYYFYLRWQTAQTDFERLMMVLIQSR